MKRLSATLLGFALFVTTVGAFTPHEVTYLGTVRVVAEASLDVMVIDERTQTESPMTFELTPQTQFFRGDHAMTAATVAAAVGERVAVTINNDVPGNKALVVRLPGH